jgi:hypothetical protein
MERSEAPEQPQPKSNRRFWQIHLSTALVLMLIVGVLGFANFVERQTNPAEDIQGLAPESVGAHPVVPTLGRPVPVYQKFGRHWYLDKEGVGWNIYYATLLLLLATAMLEALARRTKS